MNWTAEIGGAPMFMWAATAVFLIAIAAFVVVLGYLVYKAAKEM